MTDSAHHLPSQLMSGPCLFPEVCGLSGGEGGSGMCVAVEREHLSGYVVLYEAQRPAQHYISPHMTRRESGIAEIPS